METQTITWQGIKYGVYSDSACTKPEYSSVYDKEGSTRPKNARVNTLVTSYDGKVYMDDSGNNIVFVSSAAKASYNNTGRFLYIFRFYKKFMKMMIKKQSIQWQEQENILTARTSGSWYWYNDGSALYNAYINSYAGKDVEAVTGYKVNSKVYSVTIGKDKNGTVVTPEVEPEDAPETGELSLYKASSNQTLTAGNNNYDLVGSCL